MAHEKVEGAFTLSCESFFVTSPLSTFNVRKCICKTINSQLFKLNIFAAEKEENIGMGFSIIISILFIYFSFRLGIYL